MSSAIQWVVASRPSRIPAAASTSEPVQTDVVHCDVACARRSQSSIDSSCISARVPKPPGTTITSGSGSSSRVASAMSASIPFSVRFGPGLVRRRSETRGARQAREHLVGADRVERGEAVEDRDRDVHAAGLPDRDHVGGGEPLAVVAGLTLDAAARTRAGASRPCRSRSAGRSPRAAARSSRAASGRARAGATRRTPPGSCRPRAANTRAKLRGLMNARSASAGTDRSASRWSAIQPWSSRIPGRAAAWPASPALNWAWPPGRRTNSTSAAGDVERRAPAPRSSSTSASARSMPAVTPADV